MSGPLKQGDMDQLCGIYAILNALAASQVPPALQQDLFCMLVDDLAKGRKASDVLWEGVTFKRLERLIEITRDFLCVECNIVLTCKRLRRPSPSDVEAFWHILDQKIQDNKVAIIRLHGLRNHWTVVKKVGSSRLDLLDSMGLKFLNKAHCSIGEDESRPNRIQAGQALIVTFE